MNRAKNATLATAGLATAAVLLAGCGEPPEPLNNPSASAVSTDGLTRVVRLAAERAVLSDQVAASKFGTGKSVTDPAREAVVIADARSDAERDGVDPEWAAQVFTDQIAASTQVQQDLLRQWSERPETRPAEKPDLAKVRPELDRIGGELITALKDADPARSQPDCSASLTEAVSAQAGGLDDVHRAALDRALNSVCALPPK